MTTILGGGIAGLSASFYALQNSKAGSIVLIEASNRLGGWIRSRKSPTNAIFEQGPRTVRVAGPAGQNTLQLIDRLQLTEKIIPIRMFHPAASNRMIFVNNELHTLPTQVKTFFKVKEPFKRSFINILCKEIFAPRVSVHDESLYNFVERRLGQDVADYLLSPVICGICAGDAKQISVKSFAKTIFKIEQKHGSIVKGMFLEKFLKEKISKVKRKSSDDENIFNAVTTDSVKTAQRQGWAMWSLEGGLEVLPRMLADMVTLHDVKIQLNNPCEQLTFRQNCVDVITKNGTDTYSHVISSISAKALAQLVRYQHPKLARELEDIPTVTVAVVNLEFPEDLLTDPAFGFLVAPIEERPILGVTFDSCVFPHNTSTILTVMMGGAWFDKYFGKNSTEEHLLSVAVNQVKSIMKIKTHPTSFKVSLLKDCIPQYIVGHDDRLGRIQNYILSKNLPLSLCGSSYDGIGINDVILSARRAAENIA